MTGMGCTTKRLQRLIRSMTGAISLGAYSTGRSSTGCPHPNFDRRPLSNVMACSAPVYCSNDIGRGAHRRPGNLLLCRAGHDRPAILCFTLASCVPLVAGGRLHVFAGGLLVRIIKDTLAAHLPINNKPEHLSIPSTRYRSCMFHNLSTAAPREAQNRQVTLEPPSRKVCNNNPSETLKVLCDPGGALKR
ncbi:hypothetical protein IWX50DRAFT_77222 [Phyllosticta citricarpa]